MCVGCVGGWVCRGGCGFVGCVGGGVCVCVSVCLSECHELMSQADILDIDRAHIFRKHKHKNNRKVAVIHEKNGKNWPLLRFLQARYYGARTFIARFLACGMRMRDIIAYS